MEAYPLAGMIPSTQCAEETKKNKMQTAAPQEQQKTNKVTTNPHPTIVVNPSNLATNNKTHHNIYI